MFASCTLLWGLMKPHILGVQDAKQNQPQPKKTPDLGIKDKVNIFKVCSSSIVLIQNYRLPYYCEILGNAPKVSKWSGSSGFKF